MGFVSNTGDAAFNVAIRTCYQVGDGDTCPYGLGITIDSDANQNQESVDKLRFVTDYVDVAPSSISCQRLNFLVNSIHCTNLSIM